MKEINADTSFTYWKECIAAIISQSNSRLKENPATEYLLIIGNNKNKDLNWVRYTCNSEGQCKQ